LVFSNETYNVRIPLPLIVKLLKNNNNNNNNNDKYSNQTREEIRILSLGAISNLRIKNRNKRVRTKYRIFF